MLDWLAGLGRQGVQLTHALGRSGLFLFQALAGLPRSREAFTLWLNQVYSVGVLSLIIILVSGLFIEIGRAHV